MNKSLPIKPAHSFISLVDGPLLGSTVRFRKELYLKVANQEGKRRLVKFEFIVEQELNGDSKVTGRNVRWDHVDIRYNSNGWHITRVELRDVFFEQLTDNGYRVVYE